MPRRLPNHIDLNNVLYSKRQHQNKSDVKKQQKAEKKKHRRFVSSCQDNEEPDQTKEELKNQIQDLELRLASFVEECQREKGKIQELEAETEKNSKEKEALKLKNLELKAITEKLESLTETLSQNLSFSELLIMYSQKHPTRSLLLFPNKSFKEQPEFGVKNMPQLGKNDFRNYTNSIIDKVMGNKELQKSKI